MGEENTFRTLQEEDLDQIELMDLSNWRILVSVATLCGIVLQTVNPDRIRWYAIPRSGSTFSGTYAEVAAFVRGFAQCYRHCRKRSIETVRATIHLLDDMHEKGALAR